MASERSKELARVKRYIKRNEARGYQWTEEFKQSLETLSVKRLSNLTPTKLLEKAKSISPITGKKVKGTTARKHQRTLSAKKGWETRRRKERTYSEETPNINTEAYDRIMEIIDSQTLKTASIVLRDFLAQEITVWEGYNGRSGFENVCIGLASVSEEAIVSVQLAIDDSKGGQLRRTISKLGQIIKGAMLNEEEAKRMGEASESIDTMDEFFDADEEDEDELPFY